MINLDDVRENEYVSQAGTYTFEVVDVEFITTKNGNPCHTFKCETVDGEKLNLSIYLTEKSMWKYKMFLKALGHPATGEINEEEVSKRCIGKHFKGTVAKQIKDDLVTGEKVESKYFEIVKFEKAD